ncbi:hypothetical protein AB6A40_002122 [Gnathostoma spinigerum]|uniref:DNA-directed RNA polymerase n=1 Tax=Gnathostoma spinigerum TaxID=75299 RepID=A0ABD6E5T5_9BILA
MTTVYGVTMFGAVLQIKRQLKGLGINDEDSVRFARYLAQKTFASLNDAFTSSTRIKNWLRRSAAAIVKLMRPVEWVTPLGLPVVQPYLSLSERHGKLCLIPKLTKQVNAFPPNFVHSLDSTHMMLTALHCRRLGITFAAVHDCYWTHASTADIMNVICREQFIHLHKQPIVEELGKFVRKKYLPSRLRRVMERDEIKEFEDVFTPELPDGKLDIEEIRESIYFFS